MKRWLRVLQEHQWLLISTLAVLALVLGLIGFRKYFTALDQPRSFWDVLYLALQLFTLESGSVYGPAVGWELEAARLLAPGIAAIAAVKAFALVFREQLQLFRMRFVRGHVVICGLGRKGLRLARQLRAEGRRVVAIERDEGNDHIAQCRDLGVVVLPGDAADVEMLRKARLGEAACVVAVCGDDGANAEVAVHARELAQWRRGQPLQAVVHITDPQLCRLLVEQELERRQRDPYRLEFFNVFDIGARSWLSLHPATAGPDGRPLPAPHLALVGLGRMG
ncbi:MAG TPA: NAD-binding protein, partial [Acidobacteriota bacterium]|nr:NAD-binding protein [Acidobacteriota bacterium]